MGPPTWDDIQILGRESVSACVCFQSEVISKFHINLEQTPLLSADVICKWPLQSQGGGAHRAEDGQRPGGASHEGEGTIIGTGGIKRSVNFP